MVVAVVQAFPPLVVVGENTEIVAYNGSFEGFASWVFLGFGFPKWDFDISLDWSSFAFLIRKKSVSSSQRIYF